MAKPANQGNMVIICLGKQEGMGGGLSENWESLSPGLAALLQSYVASG